MVLAKRWYAAGLEYVSGNFILARWGAVGSMRSLAVVECGGAVLGVSTGCLCINRR